jgi:hypothetical protein
MPTSTSIELLGCLLGTGAPGGLNQSPPTLQKRAPMQPTIRRDESIDEDRTAEQARTVGHVSHDAQLRVDERVKTILDRREGAVERARLAARRLSEG